MWPLMCVSGITVLFDKTSFLYKNSIENAYKIYFEREKNK